MLILTQDQRYLIPVDKINKLYVLEDEGRSLVNASVDCEDITLGAYAKIEHAKTALEFIGGSMLTEDFEDKLLQVPSAEDIAGADDSQSSDESKDFMEFMKKVFKEILKN